MKLSEAQREDGNRFRIGDMVEVKSNEPWALDWRGVVGEVIGICFDTRRSRFNITLRHEGDYVTDDFEPNDLTLSLAAILRRSSQDTK